MAIQEIGNEMSAIVLEDVNTRQIRFLRAYYSEEEAGQKRRFKLVQLGVMPNHTNFSPSRLLKYRSIAK